MRLSSITYLAKDYDEAIAWFCEVLGFVLLEDVEVGPGKRWVRVAPHPDAETGFLIAQAAGDQIDGVGKAAAGRVAYFLDVDDFETMHARLIHANVTFEEAPRRESYGRVAVFRDLYGNRWDLLQTR